MFFVKAKFFETKNKGTANEYRTTGNGRDNGPFETRASAEAFARGLATNPDIAQVEIWEDEDTDDVDD